MRTLFLSILLFFFFATGAALLGGCVRQSKLVQQEVAPRALPGETSQQPQEIVNEAPKSSIADPFTIDVSGKKLSILPKEILKQTRAKKLILSYNNFTSLPSEIGELSNLEELYVDHNLLEGALPAEIRKMPRLRILNASNNHLTGIPAEIGQLNLLRELNFQNNRLDTYPLELGNLQSLETFNISGNLYSQESLQALRNLLPDTKFIDL